MTNTEWILQILSHGKHAAVPYNFSFSPPARRAVEAHYGVDFERILDFPIRMTAPESIKPLYASPGIFGNGAKDEFGVTWTTSDIDRGSPLGYSLPAPSLANFTFPDPAAEYRFANLGEWCSRNKGNFRIIWIGDLWERATFMRGMENLLCDVVENTAFVEELLERLTAYILGTMDILFSRFSFEAVALSDDYGTQHSLLISPAQWRKLVKPCLRRIYGFAKGKGARVFHHSCGNNSEIIPDFIELGLDILHPLQPEAMDIMALKAEFGEHITFCGGVSTQDLLVRATPGAVREEIRRLKSTMGRGGGYILEPGITVQADVPAQNIFAMIDEAMKK